MPSNFPARNVYIAAKFKADQLPDEFTLGDGVEYGGFTNRPLDVDFTYRVFLRAYTVEKVCYHDSKSMVSSNISVKFTCSKCYYIEINLDCREVYNHRLQITLHL